MRRLAYTMRPPICSVTPSGASPNNPSACFRKIAPSGCPDWASREATESAAVSARSGDRRLGPGATCAGLCRGERMRCGSSGEARRRPRTRCHAKSCKRGATTRMREWRAERREARRRRVSNGAFSTFGVACSDDPHPLRRRTLERSESDSVGLREYERKRDFARTPEPRGRRRKPARRKRAKSRADVVPPLQFVVQQHAARRMHWDFRLELDGVLKSWAIPKGPSLVAGERRMAAQTEDHPLEYAGFEGVIPKGEYGGGTVVVWDRGI